MTGTRIKVTNLERFRDRHGKIRLYYRQGKGPRTALRGPVGSSEFFEDYLAAAGKAEKEPKGPNSLEWLVRRYYTCRAYKELGADTRRVRQQILDRFCLQHGAKRFRHLQPRHLREIRDGMMERGPDSANHLIKALRQVCKFAVEYDHLDVDPTVGVGRLASKNKDGYHSWALEEVEAFERTHPNGT